MKFILCLIIIFATSKNVYAQVDPNSNETVEAPGDTSSEDDAELKSTEQALENAQQKKESKGSKDLAVKGFQTLGELTAFSDLSVIQKRFLPKTNRLQSYVGLSAVTNNPFFSSVGYTFKFEYNFLEEWGVGLHYFGMNTERTNITKDLVNTSNIDSESLIYTKSYTGLSLVYAPIYGKMALFNKRIIPFDLFFGLGFGSTEVELQSKSGGYFTDKAQTVSLSTGQIFAISKTLAFRWDFTWNFYNFTIPQTANSQSDISNSYNNLFINIGMSAFFPGAKYR